MNRRFVWLAAVLTSCVLVFVGGVAAQVLGRSGVPFASGSGLLGTLGGVANRASSVVWDVLGGGERSVVAGSVVASVPSVPVSTQVVGASESVGGVSVVIPSVQSAQSVPVSKVDRGVVAKSAGDGVSVAISPAAALAVGRGLAPRVAFAAPVLVRYAGQVAYELVSAQGRVYVDADSGVVLGHSLRQLGNTSEGRVVHGSESGGRDQEERGRQHEKHHDDEDEEDEDEDEHEYGRRGVRRG